MLKEHEEILKKGNVKFEVENIADTDWIIVQNTAATDQRSLFKLHTREGMLRELKWGNRLDESEGQKAFFPIVIEKRELKKLGLKRGRPKGSKNIKKSIVPKKKVVVEKKTITKKTKKNVSSSTKKRKGWSDEAKKKASESAKKRWAKFHADKAQNDNS